jgi:hypothetical protein
MLEPTAPIAVCRPPGAVGGPGNRFRTDVCGRYLDDMRPATAIVVLVLLALIGIAFTVWWFWLQGQPV